MGNKIYDIPLTSDEPENKIVWYHAINEVYTTKNGYSWLILRKLGYGLHRFFWRAIWKLGVPPKIQVFTWRIGHDLLPTNAKIALINLAFNKLYPRCNEVEETLVHAIRDCVMARETLINGGIDNRLLTFTWAGGIEWLEASMRLLNSKAFECFIIILWNIWNVRNNFMLRGDVEDPKVTWEQAANFNNKFRLYNFNDSSMLPKPMKVSKWTKPSVGWIKINIDASWDKGRMGIRVIVRDPDGFVMGGLFCFKK